MKFSYLGTCALFSSLSFASAPVFGAGAGEVLFHIGSTTPSKLTGWKRVGGYGGPDLIVLGEPRETSNSLYALELDSHQWGDPSLDTTVDTTLYGPVGVDYEQGADYLLSFHLARHDTAPHQPEKPSPFFGAFAYQVWAGHPEKGGVLLASGVDPAVRKVTLSENRRITLAVPANRAASGVIYLRFITRWASPSDDMDQTTYQQAEVSDLRLERVAK